MEIDGMDSWVNSFEIKSYLNANNGWWILKQAMLKVDYIVSYKGFINGLSWKFLKFLE